VGGFFATKGNTWQPGRFINSRFIYAANITHKDLKLAEALALRISLIFPLKRFQ